MDEPDMKICSNCKHEIPAANYTIHTIHCLRHLKVCHVCKEPVPLIDLEAHHVKFHKLLPCKECGERVCGTDLEDHVRDSCPQTMKSCRYCALDLPRVELPAHERHCGARTERCADCGEWVMKRYRQVHLDSNHGFLRLIDDPEPTPANVTNTTRNQPSAAQASGTSAGQASSSSSDTASDAATIASDSTDSSQSSYTGGAYGVRAGFSVQRSFGIHVPFVIGGRFGTDVASASRNDLVIRDIVARINADPRHRLYFANPVVRPRNGEAARTDEPPQDRVQARIIRVPVGTNGGIRKRPAPQPPAVPRRPNENPMVVLHNLDAPSTPSVMLQRLQLLNAPLRVHGRSDTTNANESADRADTSRPRGDAAPAGRATDQANIEVQREAFRNMVPMSVERFLRRFNEMGLAQTDREEGTGEEAAVTQDRISQIKASLKDLRRDLNQATAPYQQPPNNDVNLFSEIEREAVAQASELAGSEAEGEAAAAGAGAEAEAEVAVGAEAVAVAGAEAEAEAGADQSAAHRAENDNVLLPCEFCGRLISANELDLHQYECPWGRPVMLRVPRRREVRPRHGRIQPMVLCEFCTQQVPVFHIDDHQLRCRRSSTLFAD